MITMDAYFLRKLILIVLCLKVFIPMYPPTRPPSAESHNNLDSEIRKWLLLALYLSTPQTMKVIIFMMRKYNRTILDMANT